MLSCAEALALCCLAECHFAGQPAREQTQSARPGWSRRSLSALGAPPAGARADVCTPTTWSSWSTSKSEARARASSTLETPKCRAAFGRCCSSRARRLALVLPRRNTCSTNGGTRGRERTTGTPRHDKQQPTRRRRRASKPTAGASASELRRQEPRAPEGPRRRDISASSRIFAVPPALHGRVNSHLLGGRLVVFGLALPALALHIRLAGQLRLAAVSSNLLIPASASRINLPTGRCGRPIDHCPTLAQMTTTHQVSRGSESTSLHVSHKLDPQLSRVSEDDVNYRRP